MENETHSQKLLYKEVKTDLDKLLVKYQSDINNNIDFDNWDWEYEQELIRKRFLLQVMRATIFLAKIGYSGKAIKFFKKLLAFLKVPIRTIIKIILKIITGDGVILIEKEGSLMAFVILMILLSILILTLKLSLKLLSTKMNWRLLD